MDKKSPYRILMIGMHNQNAGIENFIMNYYRNINKDKFQFDFIIPYKDGGYFDKEIEELGGRVFKFSFKNDKNLFKFLKDLNCFFKNNKYEIVHCNDTGLGFLYLWFAKKYKIKYRIAHSHVDKFEKGIKGILKNILSKIYVRFANIRFSCSVAAGNFLFKKRKFDVIKNAIDYDRFKYNENTRKIMRKKLNIENNLVIGHIGRFDYQKNHSYLIDIFFELDKKVDNAILLLIGEGPLEEKIKLKINNLKIQNKVKFLGVKSNVENYIQAMDFFLLPSKYEGLGIVAIEAQFSNLPILVSDVVPEEANISHNFYKLSLENSADKWSEKILNIIKDDRANLDTDFEKSEFNIKNAVKSLENKYLELIERK